MQSRTDCIKAGTLLTTKISVISYSPPPITAYPSVLKDASASKQIRVVKRELGDLRKLFVKIKQWQVAIWQSHAKQKKKLISALKLKIFLENWIEM
jgi:hypothetical protein